MKTSHTQEDNAPPLSFTSMKPTQQSDSDTAPEDISIALHPQNEEHLQDKDNLSTDYNATTPPKTYHIPMMPPRTCNKMFPRPSTVNTPPPAQRTKPTNTQKTEPANTQPQPTCKSPLLPTPPARQHINHPFQDHHHPVTTKNQPFQDHQHSITTDFSSNHTFQDNCHTTVKTIINSSFQDHILQDSTINAHHYY